MFNLQTSKMSLGGENKNNRLNMFSSEGEMDSKACDKVSFAEERANKACGRLSPTGESRKKFPAGFPQQGTHKMTLLSSCHL